MQHSELFTLFTRYWWLIFPLFWMVAASGRIWTRHNEAGRILDMIKTHTDQGKEPPASLVEMFKAQRGGVYGGACGNGRYSEPYYTYRLWRRLFLFGLLCAVFATMSYWRDGWPDGFQHQWSGLLIPALVFGALALSNLAGLIFRPRLPPDQTPDRK
jgi:hypothetical protein